MARAAAKGEVGAVGVGGRQVYGYVEKGGVGWMVRVSLDEFDGLGVQPFQWVKVRLPRRADEVLYFASVREQLPFVWLEFRPAA